MARGEAPTLDRLAILDDNGGRKKVQPADVRGRFERMKPWVRWGLIAFFVALPWIEVGGHPAVLFDLPTRRFYLLGLVLGTGDLPILFFLLVIGGWVLVVTTALYGRVWCGWACPQTVYLEAVFRRIERVLEGSGAQRLKLDMAPWTPGKVVRKVAKWSAWLIASFVIAHIFLSYFVSLPRVFSMIADAPTEHWDAFLVAAFATGITYFNFAWFREQTCLIVCPYGRLQSAMQDKDSIVIGYDRTRGEARGKKTEGAHIGDCVDCRRCVQVCPTGIDIRNGLQMECIGCAACIDACDDVMAKMHRPLGLVRYDSERGLAGEKRRVLRPRLFAYAAAGAAAIAALAAFLFVGTPLVARVVRPGGVPWQIVDCGGATCIQNTALVHVENRSSVTRTVSLEVVAREGVQVTLPMASVELAAQARADIPVLVRADPRVLPAALEVTAKDEHGARTAVRIDVLGPAR